MTERTIERIVVGNRVFIAIRLNGQLVYYGPEDPEEEE